MCRVELLVVLCLQMATIEAGKQRTSKDWSKLTDKDWDRIEEEWETPEEKKEYEFRPPEKTGIDMEQLQALQKSGGAKNKKKIQEMIEESQVPQSGPTMMFVTVDYPGCCDNKKETEELANKWSGMLRSTGMDATAYVIENDMILFSSQSGKFAKEIKEYALSQPECVAVDWNSKRTAGPAETEEWKAKDAVKKKEKEEEKARKEEEKKAVEAAEKRLKNKKKAARKAAKAAKATKAEL
eukprot:CAMPEP_0119311500 /NCGR_PEP_ID=MMETSP1333-20130426/22645_1 /TAXON_ID=418940 /ORGANISM="Scyphosphaera apsteinii, Strain RCC1455" /LENGTH=238 /DNA_ID=CAMNT_0007315887 /DNA_START=26 /DNA_END=742 /DNA_ORIENTATION=+